MPTHTVGVTYKTDAGSVPISATAIRIDTEINEAVLVAAGATKEVDVEFTHTQIVCYCLSLLNAAGTSEATAGSLTVKGNSTGSPVPSLSLAPKLPVFYFANSGTTQQFSADITKLYLVNTGTVDLTVAIHVGLNYGI